MKKAASWCRASYVKGTSTAHGGRPLPKGTRIDCPLCGARVSTRRVKVGLKYRSEVYDHLVKE